MTSEDFEAFLDEMSYIRACEEVGPNSLEFDQQLEALSTEDPVWREKVLEPFLSHIAVHYSTLI